MTHVNGTGTESYGNLELTERVHEVASQEIVEQLRAVVPFGEFVLLTTLPRGGFQVAQPALSRDTFSRSYSREFGQFDRLSWEALRRNAPVLATEAWPQGEFETSRFATEFLQPAGYFHAAAVPLDAPILGGYPGVLWLLRGRNDAAFTQDDVAKLQSALTDAASHNGTATRAREAKAKALPLSHYVAIRHWVFDRSGNIVVGGGAFERMDAGLRQAVTDAVRQRLANVEEMNGQGERVSLADSTDDRWNFHVMTRANFPALDDGPAVFVCLQPSCEDWGALRPADFQADNELSRLVPAIKFMHENFHRSPTLTEIAATVHLSPFHFHRRFSELLGITPKHFLLDCQIGEAKALLVARQKELSELATLCGFAHQSHFTSRFKQATGLTPTRWRRLATDKINGSNGDRLSPRLPSEPQDVRANKDVETDAV